MAFPLLFSCFSSSLLAHRTSWLHCQWSTWNARQPPVWERENQGRKISYDWFLLWFRNWLSSLVFEYYRNLILFFVFIDGSANENRRWRFSEKMSLQVIRSCWDSSWFLLSSFWSLCYSDSSWFPSSFHLYYHIDWMPSLDLSSSILLTIIVSLPYWDYSSLGLIPYLIFCL